MKFLQMHLDECAARHYYLCPQVLGVRIALLGGRRLDLPVPQRDKRLLAIIETDGCAADGVAVASGCWVGRRTMRVMDFGKVAATFVDTLTEQAVRIVPRQGIRQLALDYASDAPNRWTAQLYGYQIMSDEELLDATPVVLKESIASILSRDGVRTNCQACGEEIINEREGKGKLSADWQADKRIPARAYPLIRYRIR